MQFSSKPHMCTYNTKIAQCMQFSSKPHMGTYNTKISQCMQFSSPPTQLTLVNNLWLISTFRPAPGCDWIQVLTINKVICWREISRWCWRPGDLPSVPVWLGAGVWTSPVCTSPQYHTCSPLQIIAGQISRPIQRGRETKLKSYHNYHESAAARFSVSQRRVFLFI